MASGLAGLQPLSEARGGWCLNFQSAVCGRGNGPRGTRAVDLLGIFMQFSLKKKGKPGLLAHLDFLIFILFF